MKEKLIEISGLDADATEEQIVAYVSQLKRLSNSPGARQEKQITEKIAAGLSRESAIQVLKDQAADDELRDERDRIAAEAAKVEAEKKARKTEESKPKV